MNTITTLKLSFGDQITQDKKQKAFPNEAEKIRTLGYWQSMLGEMLATCSGRPFQMLRIYNIYVPATFSSQSK